MKLEYFVRKSLRELLKMRGQNLVCEEVMAVAHVAAANCGVAAKLGDVGDKQRGSAIGGDSLARLHFT